MNCLPAEAVFFVGELACLEVHGGSVVEAATHTIDLPIDGRQYCPFCCYGVLFETFLIEP